MIFDINSSRFSRHLRSTNVADLMTSLPQQIDEILLELGVMYRERIFTPFVTLYSFLSQIFSDDKSCRKAVLELERSCRSRKKRVCSISTASFCKAKKRLRLELIQSLVKLLAKSKGEQEAQAWRHGRVLVVDGTGFSMPDTKENAALFVRHGSSSHKKSSGEKTDKPVVAFPVGRILAAFSLTTGAVLDLAISTWKGKGTGELSLLGKLWCQFQKSDTLVGDAGLSSYTVLAGALRRGCHVVSEFKKMSHGRINIKCSDQIISIQRPK